MKELKLYHPQSPGVILTVKRGWLGRIFKNKDFATLGEAIEISEAILKQKREDVRSRGRALRLKRDNLMKIEVLSLVYGSCPDLSETTKNFIKDEISRCTPI
jgi:hypothetical protein